MSATINVNGTGTIPQGMLQLQLPQETITNPVGTVQNIALAAGPNTIAVPVGSTCCIIQPPAGNLTLITLKGIAGDTGIPLHKTLFSLINLDSTSASFVLTAAAAIGNFTTITFL